MDVDDTVDGGYIWAYENVVAHYGDITASCRYEIVHFGVGAGGSMNFCNLSLPIVEVNAAADTKKCIN